MTKAAMAVTSRDSAAVLVLPQGDVLDFQTRFSGGGRAADEEFQQGGRS